MDLSADKGKVVVGQVSQAASESGAMAMAAAEVVLERVIQRTIDAVVRLRRKQPLVSINVVVVKNNNLASPLGQVGEDPDEDSGEDA